MSIELRGVVNGLIAAVVALGLVFGLSAVLAPRSNTSSAAKQNAPTSSNGVQTASTLDLIGPSVYKQYCAGCHGANGEGVMGPDIRNEDMTDSQIASIITNGSKPMPAFQNKLTSAQINAVVQYVRTLKK